MSDSIWVFVRPSGAIHGHYEVAATLARLGSTAWPVPTAPLYTSQRDAWKEATAIAASAGKKFWLSHLLTPNSLCYKVELSPSSPDWIKTASNAWRQRPCLVYIQPANETGNVWEVRATATLTAWDSWRISPTYATAREAFERAYKWAKSQGGYNGIVWLPRLSRVAHSTILKENGMSFLHDMLAAAEVLPT